MKTMFTPHKTAMVSTASTSPIPISAGLPRPSPRVLARRVCLCAVALATAFGAAGCATLQAVADVRDSQVQAEQRWAHLIGAKYQQAWAMHSPGWKDLHSFESWYKDIGTAISWKAAEAVGSDCDNGDPKRCIVRIKVTYQLVSDKMEISPVSREVEELWLSLEGQWWYLPRP